MPTEDDLTKMIDRLVEQKTFSLDAVGQIKDLRDKAADLEQKLKLAHGDNEAKRREIQILENAGNRKDETIREWAKREGDLKTREAKMTELEKTVAVETAKASVWDQCLGRMLANRMVRESIITDQPVTYTQPGSTYPSTQYSQKRDNIEREER